MPQFIFVDQGESRYAINLDHVICVRFDPNGVSIHMTGDTNESRVSLLVKEAAGLRDHMESLAAAHPPQ